MKIEVLGAYGGESPECRLISMMIGETIALDAGCLCQTLPLDRQVRISSIVLTHSHIDHTNSLPFFLDNVFGRRGAVQVHGSEATLHAVRKHLFNSAIWPDFTRLPNHLEPVIEFREFEEEQTFDIGDIRFTPIAVNHVVPTHGFLLEQGGASFLWSSDTGPTRRFWEVANRTPNLRAISIDVSFDNALEQVATDSGHLCPRLLGLELKKLERDVPVLIHHMKPTCIGRIQEEVAAIGHRNLGFLEQGRTYDFGG